jgi:ABC-2 type transport system permease protein
MSIRTYTLTDTATMLRRNVRHTLRYPSMTIGSVFGPVIMLVLFVVILGKTLGAGLASVGGGHGGGYISYIAPGIIITAVASGSMATAVAVFVDMTEGIVNRFRTMPIARVSILAAHVISSMLTTTASVLSVIAIASAVRCSTRCHPVSQRQTRSRTPRQVVASASVGVRRAARRAG